MSDQSIGFMCSSHSSLDPSCLITAVVLCTVHTQCWTLHVWSQQWFYVQFTLIAGTFMSDQSSGFMYSSHSSLEPSCLIRAVVLCTVHMQHLNIHAWSERWFLLCTVHTHRWNLHVWSQQWFLLCAVHTHRWTLHVWSQQWVYVQFTLIAGTFMSDQSSGFFYVQFTFIAGPFMSDHSSGFMYSSHSSLEPSCLIAAVVSFMCSSHSLLEHSCPIRATRVCVHDTGWQMCDDSCMGLFQWCVAGLPWRWTQTWVGGAGHEVWVPQHPADLRPWHLPSYVGPAHTHLVSFCLVPAVCLKGRLASQIWSQNVPEHVFVFFQVLVLKHAYFSSKSVFLWYMFDFYANESILWTLVCLFLSCGQSFHWKTLHFIPWLRGLSTQNSAHVAYQNVQ